MLDSRTAARLLEHYDPHRVLHLVRQLIRIPSPLWQESNVARYLAAWMEGAGLEVELQQVPIVDDRSSHNALGRLRGSGGGPTLCLCGHTDTSGHGALMYRPDKWTKEPFGATVENGYLYGLGAINMKAGLGAAIAAVDLLKRARFPLKGDVVAAAVMAETGGGVGALHMLQSFVPELAIVTEASNLDIGTVAVGYVQGTIKIKGETKHREPYNNPIESAQIMLQALGPTYQSIPQGGWLRFTPHPELPGYPRVGVRSIASEQDACLLKFDLRTVPGMTEAQVREDLERLVARLHTKYPHFHAELIIPGTPYMPNMPSTAPVDRGHPLVTTVAHWHEHITGRPPVIGAGHRLGATADSGHMRQAGTAAIDYGPGFISVWPMIDERIEIEQIHLCAKVLALTAASLCG